MGEFNFYDIYIPTLLIQALIAYVILKLLGGIIQKWVVQGWIALPGVFNLCLYLILLLLVHQIFIGLGV